MLNPGIHLPPRCRSAASSRFFACSPTALRLVPACPGFSDDRRKHLASKDGLIDELLRLATQDLLGRRRARAGPHQRLRPARTAAGVRSFAGHARYANLLLQRQPDTSAAGKLRQVVSDLTARAVSAGTVHPGISPDDVIILISAIRGLIHVVPGGTPDAWPRFLDIHLTGMSGPCGPSRGPRRY